MYCVFDIVADGSLQMNADPFGRSRRPRCAALGTQCPRNVRKCSTTAVLFFGEWFPSTHWTVVGPTIVGTCCSNSSGVPKGSLRPDTNNVGTVMSGKCPTRRLSGFPGGCRGYDSNTTAAADRPSATATEQARPPKLRPPYARRSSGAPGRSRFARPRHPRPDNPSLRNAPTPQRRRSPRARIR